jgi:hypothetical protein
MQLGTVDMTITGESLQNWTPMAALLAIPYGYQSLEDMDEVASGEIGDQIEAGDHRERPDPAARLLRPRPAQPHRQPRDHHTRRAERPAPARAERAALRGGLAGRSARSRRRWPSARSSPRSRPEPSTPRRTRWR